MSHILQILAEAPEAQHRLRRELMDSGDLDHDTIMGLPYLDAVVRETLRVHPAVSVITRQSTQDSVLPLGSTVVGLDGRRVHTVAVPKGTTVILDIAGANTDPSIWGEDAGSWRPERWLDALSSKVLNGRISSAHSHLLTFSAGPKSCLGVRFALTSIKIFIAHLVTNYAFSPTEQEVVWTTGVITSPTIKGHDEAILPLRVVPVHRC